MRIFMGGRATAPTTGESTFEWLMEGRWTQSKGKGSMLGMPVETLQLLGYDNFKMSYVTASVAQHGHRDGAAG